MAGKRGKNPDAKSVVIAVLSFIICAETVLLYQFNPERFVGFFVHRKTAHVQPAPKSAERLHVMPAEPVSAVPVPAPTAIVPSTGTVKVAFIIDDWGYTTKNCQYLRDIKSPMAVAVLPDLPHSNDVMQCAHESGKTIMLHLPMEPHSNPDQYPPDYILKTTMTPIKVDRLLSNILDKMPLVEGVNNHMGSKATEDRRLMTTVFKQLRYRNLFFVDSRVTAKSVCAPLAKEMGVPFTSRDVFLDNVNERAAITTQLASLARIAKKRGWAVAIGHDRSLTLQVIEERIPWFKEQGIDIVPIKDLISQ